MKKLLLKISLLVFLTAFIMSLSLFLPRSEKDPVYDAAAIDKHRILKNTEPPRIIFIGGSNVAFGLDSKLVEHETGLRTVNMALDASYGLRYMLEEVKPYLGKNDIVVVIPEYQNFYGTFFDGRGGLAYHFIGFPEGRKYITSWKQYMVIFKNYSYGLRMYLFNLLTGGRFSVNDSYCRKAFNEYGDLTGHLCKRNDISKETRYYDFSEGINKDVVPVMNNFNLFAERSGARVFFIYPCIMDLQYIKGEKGIALLHDMLKKELTIPILSLPSEYVFPEAYFYDTVYHLNAEGRTMRTQKIILDLKKCLSMKNGRLEIGTMPFSVKAADAI